MGTQIRTSYTSLSDFAPDWIIPPGETISDVLDERGWTQTDLAKRADFSTKHVYQLLRGEAPITQDTAAKLEKVLGSTARFWVGLDTQYREQLARRAELIELEKDVDWLKELPLADMRRFKWIKAVPTKAQLVLECLKFFAVSSVEAWRNTYAYPVAAYRAAPKLKQVMPVGSGLKSAGAREATRPGGHWGYRQGTFVADPSKPARTVTAAATQDWIRDGEGRLRRLTWRECAALQGFPVDWQFVGNKASRFRQIGNAVPVTFGRVLGESLFRVLADEPLASRPASAPFPAGFVEAITYTRREHSRNGPSRAAARAALASGQATVAEAKGLGSAERNEVASSFQV